MEHVTKHFSAAGGGLKNGMVLENKHLEKAQIWTAEFDKHGVKAGMERLLGMYFSERSSAGPAGADPVALSKDSFNTEVIVPLLLTHTGLLMTLEQQGTMKALTSLVSTKHVPESLPMKAGVFLLKFKTHQQPLAIPGQMSTKVPTAGAYFHNIETKLEKRVAGFSMGELDFLFENNPEEIIGLLAEKLESLSTTWGLTAIFLHAQYAASQPSVSQLLLTHQLMHQPRDLYAKLLQYCFMDHMMCGAINRAPDNIRVLLGSFGDHLRLSEDKEFVVLFPQRISEGVAKYSKQNVLKVSDDKIVYTTKPTNGVEHYCHFGSAKPVSAPQTELVIPSMSLPNGTTAHLISISGSGGENPAGPLITQGVKRLYATIGACPDVYESKCHPGYFDTESDTSVCPKTVTEHSPGTTYIMDFDRNTTAKLTVQQCNKHIAAQTLFIPTDAAESWFKTFKKEHLGFINEAKTAAMLKMSKKDMLASPLMMYETNPRMMWVMSPNNKGFPVKYSTQQSTGTPGSYIYYIPRAVLGNASPCSTFANEIVGAVGQLSHMVKSFTSHLTDLVDRMVAEMDRVNPVEIRRYRQLDNMGAPTTTGNGDATTLLAAISNMVLNPGLFTDPTCQCVFLEIFDSAVKNNDALLMAYMAANSSFLYKLVNTIRGAIKEINQLIGTIYESSAYNAIMGANQAIIVNSPGVSFMNLDKYEKYLKFAYGIIMPALTDRVEVANGGAHEGDILSRAVSNDATVGYIKNGVFVSKDYTSSTSTFLHPYGAPAADICLVRPLFMTRLKMLHKTFAGTPMIKILALMHYWTAYNHVTLEKHLDKMYYSGLAYMAIRQVTFNGHSIAGVPIKGARMLLGNKYAGFPVATWEQTEYKQCMEMGVIPTDIESIGITVPNAFMSDIEGLGSSLDLKASPRGILIVDSYNCYLPEAISTHQPGMSMLPVQGRFNGIDDLTMPDISGLFCQLPTAFLASSDLIRQARVAHVGYGSDSSLGLIDSALDVKSFMEGLPQPIRGAVDEGYGTKEMLTQVINSRKRPTHIFEKTFGGLFTEDYVVGAGSSAMLKGGSGQVLNPELMPRIVSHGGINANAIYGSSSADPPFMAAFTKQFSVAKVTNHRTF